MGGSAEVEGAGDDQDDREIDEEEGDVDAEDFDTEVSGSET